MSLYMRGAYEVGAELWGVIDVAGGRYAVGVWRDNCILQVGRSTAYRGVAERWLRNRQAEIVGAEK